MSSTPLVELHGLQVRRGGRLALDVSDLAIAAGETLAVVGPNGSGKTTLLRVLAQIGRHDQGHVVFRGAAVRSPAQAFAVRRQVAMVFDEPLLFTGSVHKNVAAGLAFRKLPRSECTTRVQEALARFRIEHLANRDSQALSLGEAQRVSLARAFAVAPTLLLLDEPFHGLDPVSREALLDDLATNLHHSNITTVFTTHDLDEARRLGDRLLVMRAGCPVQVGPPAQVLRQPVDEEVAALVGMVNTWAAQVRELRQDTFVAEAGGHLIHVHGQAERGETIVLGIRPEDVTLTTLDTAPAANALRGRIASIVPRGPCRMIRIDCALPLTALVMDGGAGSTPWRDGDNVFVGLPPAAIHAMRQRPATSTA